jgi:hypothetical protein
MTDWWRKRVGEWERDEFGLPLKSKGEENAGSRLLGEAEMRAVAGIHLALIFRKLHEGLGGGKDGVKKARRCFDHFASKKHQYRKGQHGANDLINERLLDIYDASNMSPSAIGNGLHTERPGVFGNSAEAIEKKLRRLLEQRAMPKSEIGT